MEVTPIRRKIREMLSGFYSRHYWVEESPSIEEEVEFFLGMLSKKELIGSLEGKGLDGFSEFHLFHEDKNSINCVGLSYLLPDGLVPFQLNVKLEMTGINYELVIGRDDENWVALSNSKKWNAVYQLATEDDASDWEWRDRVSGYLQ